MSFHDQLPPIVLFAFVTTLLVDVLVLPLRLVNFGGFVVVFGFIKRFVSNALGLLLILICVPGAMLSLGVCFLRTWADNQFFFILLMLFVAGAIAGLFLSSDALQGRRVQV